MSNIIEVQKIINTRNEATKWKEYAQKKVQDWSNIANAFQCEEVLCNLLLDKDYVMNLHNLVEKQEEISTQADAQHSENDEKEIENDEKEIENIQEPSVVEQEIQEEELSEENVNECATTKESELSKETEVKA